MYFQPPLLMALNAFFYYYLIFILYINNLNKDYNVKTMNNKKQIIRLTESQLRSIIKESVKNVLNEIGDTPRGQYMLGRLNGRQRNQGYENDARYTNNYAAKQMGSRTPQNFEYHDAKSTAHHLGYLDETDPELSKDMMSNNNSIGNYHSNVRNNYLKGVSKF